MATFPLSLAALADELGQLKAEQARLKEREARIRAQLDASGERVIEGSLFRVTISDRVAKRVDWRAVAAKLHPSRQLVTAHTSEVTSTSFNVRARKGQQEAA